jgi:excisionase family DNA binding protein
MTKTVLQIENIEAQELITRLDKLEVAIYAFIEQPANKVSEPETEYLTRRQIADLFKISIVTVHDWTKKGILIAYKLGNKVFYKRAEVEQALVKKVACYV